MVHGAMDEHDAGLLELRRHLESYADARLTPSVGGTLSMRTHVMNAAHRRAALLAADNARRELALASEREVRDRGRATSMRRSRVAAGVLAATVAISVLAGTASAAQAGRPFYALRLWVEDVNLPANLLERAQAEGRRLDQRIAEAQQASIDGDAGAVEAALAAYSVIVVEAGHDVAGDPTASAAVGVLVAGHVEVLNELAATAPQGSRGGVDKALALSSAVIRDMSGDSTRSHGGPPPARVTPVARPTDSVRRQPGEPKGDKPVGGGGIATPASPAPTHRVSNGPDHSPTPSGQSRHGGSASPSPSRGRNGPLGEPNHNDEPRETDGR